MYATLDALLYHKPGAQYAVHTDDGWEAAHNYGSAMWLANDDPSRITALS